MLHKLENRAEVEHSSVGMKLWLGWVGLSVAVGLAYFLTAQLGLALLTTAERVAVFWPASGIAVGILIALGGWARGPVAAGVIVATLAANLMADRSVWSALAFGLCNAAEALLAIWLIERWFGPALSLDSLRRVLRFFAAAAVAAATAAVGAAGAMKLFGPSTAAFLDVWEVWFASDALGIIAVAPLLIGVRAAVRDRPPWRELLEGTLAVAAVTATIGFLLVLLSGPWEVVGPGAFLFPLLLWLGYRCRPVFAAAAVFTIAAAIVWTTTHEFGRYGDSTQATAIRVIAAQTAMLGTTLAALALAALFAERRRSEAALRESDTRLRSSLDAANVIAWDIDLTSETVHSAGPVARLLHRPEGSVPDDFAAMVETIHPGDRDSVMAQFWAAVRAPLHPTTARGLKQYLALRQRHLPTLQDGPFLASARGTALAKRTVHWVFDRLRKQLGWTARGGHAAPRIHDLRHTFVCRRVQLWHEHGTDIDNAMVALSTYVGHAKVSDTYWYLTAAPDLMSVAARRFEQFVEAGDA